MSYLTKNEWVYLLVSTLASLSVLVTIVAFWVQPEPNCWKQYSTEQEAIYNCENHNEK